MHGVVATTIKHKCLLRLPISCMMESFDDGSSSSSSGSRRRHTTTIDSNLDNACHQLNAELTQLNEASFVMLFDVGDTRKHKLIDILTTKDALLILKNTIINREREKILEMDTTIKRLMREKDELIQSMFRVLAHKLSATFDDIL